MLLKWSWFQKALNVTHTASSKCRIISKIAFKEKLISCGNVLFSWIGFESSFDIKNIKKAHAKIGAEAMMKSNKNGILGFSYLIPVLLDENRFNSLIVVPVARQSTAWLNSWTIVPGKRKPFTPLILIYFLHNAEIAKLKKTIKIRPIAREKYIINYILTE